ncbi:hypothetical protein [Nocardioides sp.]|uniref:hypothetical protein n=1 Tax=Nocardioides sp. TaxID=35761 RepID=UPI0039E58176
MKRYALAAVAVALTLTGFAAAPAQAVTWPAPVVVAGPEPSFSYRYDIQTVIAPDGTTVASWTDAGGLNSVMVAERPVGGSWSTPVGVATANVWGDRLAVGSDGTLAIVYQNVVGGKVVTGAVVRPAGSAWEAPVTLSDTTKTSTSANVAVGAGMVTAVWVQDSGANAKVMVNSRPVAAAGAWGSAITFVDTGVSDTEVAAGPTGTLVTWLLSSDPADSYAANTVRSSFHGTTGSWLAPETISGTGRRTTAAEPAIGIDGTLAVAWESRLPGTTGYYTSARALAAVRPPGGGWSAEQLLSDPTIEGRSPQVGVGPDGSTTVVWESYDGATRKVATRTYGGGAWGPEAVLTQSVDDESAPLLAVSPDGTAVVLFERLNQGSAVAVRAPGGPWRPSEIVMPATRLSYYRALAAGTGGIAIVWIFGDDDDVLAVVADHALPLPPLPSGTDTSSGSAETGPITGPAKIKKGKSASYSFAGTPVGVTFQCRVDTSRRQQTGVKGRKAVAWKSCSSPVKVRTKKLRRGKHTLYVRAVLDGVPDPTPATRRFRVR